jgi:hypothetical protein
MKLCLTVNYLYFIILYNTMGMSHLKVQKLHGNGFCKKVECGLFVSSHRYPVDGSVDHVNMINELT